MKRCLLAISIVLCAGVTSTEASATSFVQKLIAASAERFGVPKTLALKVAKVESSFTCDAEGKAGELGPLQIKPATARMIGYRGIISALRSCGAGLEWGMKHLAMALRAGGVWKHNQGLAAKSKSPAAAEYERKVLSQKVLVPASSPVVFGSPLPAGAAAAMRAGAPQARSGLTYRQAVRNGLRPALSQGS